MTISAYSLTEELVDLLYGNGLLFPNEIQEAREVIFKVCQESLNEPEENSIEDEFWYLIDNIEREYLFSKIDSEMLETICPPMAISEADFFRENGA